MLKKVMVSGKSRDAIYRDGQLVGYVHETQRFARNGKRYDAHFSERGVLLELVNKTSGEVIPPETQSFRRLADGNRGNKFKAA